MPGTKHVVNAKVFLAFILIHLFKSTGDKNRAKAKKKPTLFLCIHRCSGFHFLNKLINFL